MHARVRAYNSADVFDAGIFPSPAVRRRERVGGGGKKRRNSFLHNRKHGVARINGFFD